MCNREPSLDSRETVCVLTVTMPEEPSEQLRELRLKVAAVTEQGELRVEQAREAEDELRSVSEALLAFVESLPEMTSAPPLLAEIAGAIEQTLADRRAALHVSARSTDQLLAVLATDDVPARQLPLEYDLQAATLERLAVSARAVAALGRLRLAMQARGWIGA